MNWNSKTQSFSEVKSKRVIMNKHFAQSSKGLMPAKDIASILGVSVSRVYELQRLG